MSNEQAMSLGTQGLCDFHSFDSPDENVFAVGELAGVSLDGAGAKDGKTTQELLFSANVKRHPGYRFVKRLFDFVFSLIVIVVLFIPALILCVIVAIDTKGTPLYGSTRVGHKGPFHFYKFRTMVADSDDLEKYLTPAQIEEWHREHKVKGDPRITRFGRILRKTSIDEFPQFLNVLLGQMSVIGPRCVTEEELVALGKDRALYVSVPSGITGAWQVSDRNDASWENGLRQKIEFDYALHASLGRDASIFFKTFGAMFIKRSGN